MPKFIPFVFPGIDTVKCAFTTSLAGNLALNNEQKNDNILQARKDLQQQLGFREWSGANQVHGLDLCLDIDQDTLAGGSIQADGLTSCKPGQALIIKTADCQPLLLTDTSGNFLMALHVGWRGNREDFIALAVSRFCKHYKLVPKDILAVRGPSLGPAHSEFVNFETEWGDDFRAYFDEQERTMNLWKLTHDQLLGAGLYENNIFSLDLCTYSLKDYFFSYRRAHEAERQVSCIWKTVTKTR